MPLNDRLIDEMKVAAKAKDKLKIPIRPIC
ncbi:MAG: hypothetical protein FD151_1336 [bacterium]|jgi:hypothetical protein|nr:MAG: hypothetical protein FD151_1336 [bacterium]